MSVCACEKVCRWLAGREWVVKGVSYMAPLSKLPEGGLQLWMNVWDKECVCVGAVGSSNEENLKRWTPKCQSSPIT